MREPPVDHEYSIQTVEETRGYKGRKHTYTREYTVGYTREGEVFIKWACGDVVGGWTVERFEDLLKQIARVPASKGLILPVEIPNYETYGVMLADDGTVMYGEGVAEISSHGPSLAELKKALASIKRHIKKQAARAEKEAMTV